jgi:putative redox protein
MINAASTATPFRVAFGNGRAEAFADRPPEKGGAGDGFGPHDLLEAALATCLAMTVTMHAAKHGWPVRQARAAVRLDRSRPDEVVFEYTLDIDGDLTDDQRAALRAAAANCPVSQTLAKRPAVRPKSSP